MGLYISTLNAIPKNAERSYYIYLLDYGWNEPLTEALQNNFDRMAQFASENDAVIIKGIKKIHFEDEVLSWHSINGQDAEELLPAILITNRHPGHFKESNNPSQSNPIESDLKLILIPLKKFCSTTTEVTSLIEKLFKDIQEKQGLENFKIAKEIKKDRVKSFADSLILEPNVAGMGLDLKKLFKFLKPH